MSEPRIITPAEAELVEAMLDPRVCAIMYPRIGSAVAAVRAERKPKPRWTWDTCDPDPTAWARLFDRAKFMYALPINHARILVDALNEREAKG